VSKVANISDYKRHISGNAKCLSCGYEWVAIAPAGATTLECTECKTNKGVFTGLVSPETVYECECGNQHFYISPDDLICSLCGLSADL